MTNELDIPKSWKCFDCVDYMLGGKCPSPYWCDIVDGPRDYPDYQPYQPEKSEAKNDKDNM